jgi:hypothetical protein
MASKEVADLTHAAGWVGVEFHIVEGVVRDGGGNVVSHGNSRRITLEELVALIGTVAGVTFASSAEVKAGTVNNKVIAPDKLHLAAAPQVLADAATVNWNMQLGYNAKVTLGGNRTIGAPTNGELGLSYVLELIQDATGNRVPVWDAAIDWGAAGAPTLSTVAGKRDLVSLYCYDAATPKFRATFNKAA